MKAVYELLSIIILYRELSLGAWLTVNTYYVTARWCDACSVHDRSSRAVHMLKEQYLHVLYMLAHASEEHAACGCLHAARVYIHTTRAAGTVHYRILMVEYNREDCSKTS